MSESFSTFRANRQAVSAGTLSALIQLQRQDLLTGLVEVVYPGKTQALIFFNLGTPFTMFHYTEGHWRKVPSTQWNDIFAHPNGEAGIIPMGGDSLRMCLLALESWNEQSEEILPRPAGFAAHLDQLNIRESASLLQVWDESFHGVVITPGRKLGTEDVLVFSSAGVQADLKSLTRLIGTEDRLLRIKQAEFPQLPPFLQEYALKVAFISIASPTLKRFEQLAGDTLLESLGQEVNNYAFHQGWKIQFYGNRIMHRQFFPEANEAVVVYRGLFRMVRHYIHRVVGAALTTNILNEGVTQLPDMYRDVFNQRNFLDA